LSSGGRSAPRLAYRGALTNPDPTKINGAILVAIAADSARFGGGHQRPHMPSDLRRRTSGDGGDRTPDALL